MDFRARGRRRTVAVVPAVLGVGGRRDAPLVARRHHGFVHFQRWLVRRAIKTVAIVIHPRLPAAVLLDAVVPRTTSVVVLLPPALGRAVGPSAELAPTTAVAILSTITARSVVASGPHRIVAGRTALRHTRTIAAVARRKYRAPFHHLLGPRTLRGTIVVVLLGASVAVSIAIAKAAPAIRRSAALTVAAVSPVRATERPDGLGFPGCRLPGLSAALRHACAIIRHNRTTFHHLLRPLALPGVAIVVVAVSVAKAAPAIRRSPGLRGIIVDDSPALRHAAVAIRHNRTTVIFYGTPVILRWQGTGDGLGTSTSVVLAPIESVVALSTSVVKAPDASVVRLHHSAYIGSLIVERRQVRRRCAVREEPAIVSRRNTRSRCATRVQALPRGDHRQVGSHHAALAHLSGIHAKAPVVHGIVAKVLSGDGSYRSAHASIGQDQVGVGESSLSSAAQWRYHVGPVDHVDIGHVDVGDVYHV